MADGDLGSAARAAAVAATVLLAEDGWPDPGAGLHLARRFAAVLLAHAAEAAGGTSRGIPPDLDAATWILEPRRRARHTDEYRLMRATTVMRDSAAKCRAAWPGGKPDAVAGAPIELAGFMVQALLESLRRAAEGAAEASNEPPAAAARFLRRLAGEVLSTAVALSVAAGDAHSLATCLAAKICAQVPTSMDSRLLPAVAAILEAGAGGEGSRPPAAGSPLPAPPVEVISSAAPPPPAPAQHGGTRSTMSARVTNLSVVAVLALAGLTGGMLALTFFTSRTAAPVAAVRPSTATAGTPDARPSPGPSTAPPVVSLAGDPRRATVQLADLPPGYTVVQQGPATMGAGGEAAPSWDVVYRRGQPATAGFDLVESISVVYADADRASAALDAQVAREVAAGAERRSVAELGKDASLWIETSPARPQAVLVRVLLRAGAIVGVIGVVTDPERGVEMAVEQARAQLRRSAAG